ncbi:MAG: HPr-rel-A system PqqD family peptide chaperone [Halochromatium sp.]
MDDGGILFDETTWKTHILTASAALIYETLIEQSGGDAVTMADARDGLRDALDLDPDSPDSIQLLAMLKTLGVIRA